jgi:hypothetical protein
VIDELMGHQRNRHGDLDGGSRIGARYRHTIDAMALRVVEAIQERLTITLRGGRGHTSPTARELGRCSRHLPVRTFLYHVSRPALRAASGRATTRLGALLRLQIT